jgi:mRNA interferase RelE/StbE
MPVVFGSGARKSLLRLPTDHRRQILRGIEAVAADPNSRRRAVEALAGSDLFRLRVGSYRLLYSIDEPQGVLTVELIRIRGDVSKR